MKKAVSLALVFLMVFSFGSTAFAADAQYKLTRDFLTSIDGFDGLTWTVQDTVSDSTGNYEVVSFSYDGEYSEYVNNFVVLFAEDASEVQLYMYNLISFDKNRLPDVLAIVNDLNHRATGVKLFVDESDYSVTLEMYQLLPDTAPEELAALAVGFFIGISDSIYEDLVNNI